jgi:hypothetical protein
MRAQKLGANQQRTLEFVSRHPGWHSYSKKQHMQRAVASLHARGLIEYDPATKQIRKKQP